MICAHLKQYTNAAIHRRTPSGAPPLRVSARRIYILPTGTGTLFGILLIAMLLGATNYGNNLAFVLTFWLGATALVSMHRAHRNLAGLRVDSVYAAPVFVGQRAVYTVRLTSDARLARPGLCITAGSGRADPGSLRVTRHTPADTDLIVQTTTRGWHACPVVRIESRYPMGLFRCWTRIAPSAPALIYPLPCDTAGVPIGGLARETAATERDHGDAAFISHRRYQPGDSPRHVDWKASARSNQLLVTEHAETIAPTRWFDYDALSGLEHEARLSQLAFWIVEADRAGTPYGLRLPEARLGPATGPAHRHVCLRALALF